MYKNILIPTDGSEFSEKVLTDGVALAKLCGAKVTGVHVYPSFHIPAEAAYVVSDLQSPAELTGRAKAKAREFLDRIEAAVRAAGLEFEGVALQDDLIWRGIIATATKNGCDLIAMAAHGRRGLAALVLGSETNKVLTHSKIPVLVYR